MAAESDFTPSTRIRELSTISADVSSLLSAAGQAINALTNLPLHHNDSTQDDEDVTMTNATAHPTNGDSGRIVSRAEREEAFQRHTTEYYTHLQSIIARLRRQSYALEEAGIISSESAADLLVRHAPTPAAQSVGGRGASQAVEVEKIDNNGLGSHEIGWLNSRANTVGAGKERELVGEARELLEGVLAQRERGSDG